MDDPLSIADYVADATAIFAAKARAVGLDSLSYILEMAALEAQEIKRTAQLEEPDN